MLPKTYRYRICYDASRTYRYRDGFTCSISSPSIIIFTFLLPIFCDITTTFVFFVLIFIPYSSVTSCNFVTKVSSHLAVLETIPLSSANHTKWMHSPPTVIPSSSPSVFLFSWLHHNIYTIRLIVGTLVCFLFLFHILSRVCCQFLVLLFGSCTAFL